MRNIPLPGGRGSATRGSVTRSSVTRRTLRFLTICVSVSTLGAQQAADAPTFKAESNLVVINVAVKDKSGRPITTLTKNDFKLMEDGKAQTISVFELQKLDSQLLAPLAAPAGQPRTLVERTAAAPAAPSRSGPIRFQDRRLLALFFDFSSMQPPEQARAVDAALKFLETQMTKSDLVEILTFGTQMNVVQDFTDNRDLLMDTVRKFRLGDSSELAALGDTGAAAEGDDTGAFVADETEFNIFNTDRKLAALEAACRKLSAFTEKKALVYFSSGVEKTGVDNQSQLRATVNAAVRSNVAFYPVDARGLLAAAPAGDASVASPKGTGVFTGSKQQSVRNSYNDSQETLYTLAADTGGKALLDSNDLSLGIQQAQNDINSYYIIGYYSTNPALDGRYRRIKLELISKQQAKLDYRNGYYAGKEFKNFNGADKERQLEEALDLGDPVTELPLALEVDYFRIAKDKYFVPISVKVPGSVLELAKKGGKSTTQMDFIGQVRDANGKLVGGVRDEIPVKLNEADAAKLTQRQIEYDTGLTLPPGKYTLRFLARENQSGKMGTFETKFTVPDLNMESKTLRMSSVIWSNQREALSAAVGSAGVSKKLLEHDPLVQDGQKLVPSITRVFRRDQNMYVYFEVYDPVTGNTEKAPAVEADMMLFRGGRKAFESGPVRMNELAPHRLNMVPVQLQLPLEKVQPGEYTCQVNVIDALGRKFAFPRGTFVVLAK
ncbi:MAG: VWA domain-containing protein [Bryobacteraceae bacterium]